MNPQPSTPLRAQALIALVSVAGIGAVAYRVTQAGDLTGRDLLALVLVMAAVIVADRFTLVIPHEGGDTEHFTLSDGVWTAALASDRARVPTLAAALGTAAWQLASRWPLRKVAFERRPGRDHAHPGRGGLPLGGRLPDPLSPATWRSPRRRWRPPRWSTTARSPW